MFRLGTILNHQYCIMPCGFGMSTSLPQSTPYIIYTSRSRYTGLLATGEQDGLRWDILTAERF